MPIKVTRVKVKVTGTKNVENAKAVSVEQPGQ